MKIECVKEKLGEAVSKAEKITAKNSTLPILNCLLLETKSGELIIQATNLDLGIKISIPVKVEREGIVAVPGAILNAFLSGISSVKNIVIEVIDGNIKINTEHTSTVIKALNHEDFPKIPILSPTESKVFSLPTQDFIKGLRSVSYSSAVSSIKPELSSVYIHADGDKLIFAATDSFRLAEKKVKLKKHLEIQNLLIPIRNIPDIIRTLEQAKADIQIIVGKNQISFKDNGLYVTSRLVDGTFPDYKQIIPKEAKTTATLLKQDFAGTLKTATIFSDKFNKLGFSIYPGKKSFIITAQNPDVGESSNTLDAVCEGEDLAINFNHRYVADCLNSVEADSVALEFNGLSRPLVIKGINDPSFLYLVMPINK